MDRTLRVWCCLVFAGSVLLTGPVATRAAPAASPLQVFAPVLIYHHVKPLKPSDDAIERGLTVLPSQFESQLRYLRTAGFHAVTVRELIAYLRNGPALPARPVALTFDDGYRDVFQGSYQPLLRAQLKATFFIVPSLLGTARYLTWKQVEIMAAHGMDIEAHSMTHPDLTLLGPRSLRWQLSESRRELEANLHRAVRIFAYPYGAFNRTVVSAVTRAGYLGAFTTQEGWQASGAKLFTEPRVYVDIDDTPAIFAGRVQDDPRVFARDPA